MEKIVLLKKFSKDYEEVFIEKNYSVLFIEPLQFKYVNNEILINKITQDFDGLILTSPRSIESVSNVWTPEIRDLWKSKKVYTVGAKSASLIKSMLGIEAIGSHTGESALLAEFILEEEKTKKKYLFPCGNLRSDFIVDKLTANGMIVDSVTTYETVENENFVQEVEKHFCRSMETITSIVFFSPSGVNIFNNCLNQINLHIESFKLFAIGKTTEKRMMELNWKIRGVASKPSPHELVECFLKV